MKFASVFAALAMVSAPTLLPAAALAHTKVVASTPAEGTTVGSARVVTLTFSEALLPPTAAASIVMTAMPGMKDHPEMLIRNFTPSWSADGKTMTLTLKKPLPAGTYDVRWQAAGADGRVMTGKVSFDVS